MRTVRLQRKRRAVVVAADDGAYSLYGAGCGCGIRGVVKMDEPEPRTRTCGGS
jgi:hypothetical protein